MLLNLIEEDFTAMRSLYIELCEAGVRCSIIFGDRTLCGVSHAMGEIVISNYPVGNAQSLNVKTLNRFIELNSNRLSFNALMFNAIIRRRYEDIL